MTDIIVKYANLSEEEKQRQRDFYEGKRKHDEATALAYARQQGYAIGFAETQSKFIAKLIEISVDELMSKEKAKNRTDAIAEGLAEGISEGEKILCLAIAESLRKNGFTEEQIKLVLGSARREERAAIAENMRKNDFTEEQIKLALGDSYIG